MEALRYKVYELEPIYRDRTETVSRPYKISETIMKQFWPRKIEKFRDFEEDETIREIVSLPEPIGFKEALKQSEIVSLSPERFLTMDVKQSFERLKQSQYQLARTISIGETISKEIEEEIREWEIRLTSASWLSGDYRIIELKKLTAAKQVADLKREKRHLLWELDNRVGQRENNFFNAKFEHEENLFFAEIFRIFGDSFSKPLNNYETMWM